MTTSSAKILRNRLVKMDVMQNFGKVSESVESVILGKHEAVQKALIALLCQGHLLIEDVPGVGKTMLARAIAHSIGCSFSRIQFTPDMLPSDITGVRVFNQQNRQFEFRKGPIFANIVLADEINRATPKTQSALLEAMEERQVTVDGETHLLDRPFMVIATQNPIEYEGTFSLPEAQLDRFMMRLRIGYPAMADEETMLVAQQYDHPLQHVKPVVSASELLQAQENVKGVYVSDLILEYILNLTRATRSHPDIYLGASPRGSLALYKAGQAMAVLAGRDYVIPDDIKALAEPALAHRLIINPGSRLKHIDPNEVLGDVVASIPVPETKNVKH